MSDDLLNEAPREIDEAVLLNFGVDGKYADELLNLIKENYIFEINKAIRDENSINYGSTHRSAERDLIQEENQDLIDLSNGLLNIIKPSMNSNDKLKRDKNLIRILKKYDLYFKDYVKMFK